LGSFSVTRIAEKALPRYHFAAREGFFFERLPYKTIANNRIYITRFIGLARLKKGRRTTEKD